ncbi:MAG: hypothetical protein H0X39_15700, partial [Actinobacteria bacterium]|nr:hypothetical protein [Actinomycetota bacterium]
MTISEVRAAVSIARELDQDEKRARHFGHYAIAQADSLAAIAVREAIRAALNT